MKKLSIILIILILVSSIPIESFAINSEQEFFNYLDSIGTRKTNSSNKVASYSTYKEYNLVVYGDPWGDTKPTGINGKTGPQQRYLGYTLENDAYTNSYFPPDATSGNKPEDFNYIKPSGASESWVAIQDSAQKEHMLYSPMSGNGATSQSFTLSSIGGLSYGKLLSPSTWKSQGSIYLQHKGSNDKIWYITQTTPPMVGDTIVTGEILTPSNTYYIRKDDTQVTIPTTVTARAVITGKAKDTHIREIKATSLGQSQTASKSSTVSKTSDFVATRANYKPGTHTVTLNGSVSLNSIFNDTGSSNVSKTITLIVEEEGDEPYVTTTVDPNPKEKKFENKDIDVTLTIKGDLHNYTNVNNIVEWKFYAREKEVTQAVIKKVYTKTLNANTTFKFKIPASKIVGNNFIQQYVVRAEVLLSDDTTISAAAETFVTIYKDVPPNTPPETVKPEPPVDDNLPPFAMIIGPRETVIGSSVVIADGSGDPDGYITNRFWGHTANGTLTDDALWGELTFPEIGVYKITLVVIDDKGAGAYAEHEINVIPPPPPVATLKINGILKENRLIQISNDSSSHHLYPIVDSKTTIEIIPEGDGATSNIKFSGTLTDTKTKDITFKNSGTYKFKISVTNTAGLTDTKEYIKYIQPDTPPIADFSLIQKLYRDPFDNNYAKMEITDLSFSPDGDPITEKNWSIRYNSTNNKNADGTNNFSDDPILIIKDSQLTIGTEKTYTHNGVTYKVTKISTDKINIKVNQIGAYLLDLEVIEGLGQDFIPDYISTTDYQKGDTSHKHHFEKTITVFNREPFVDFN